MKTLWTALLLMFIVATAKGQYTIAYLNTSPYGGAMCSQLTFTVNTTGHTSGLHVKATYGDGTTDSIPVSLSNEAICVHTYLFAGTYSVKLQLRLGAVAMDSASFSSTIVTCNYFYIGGFIDLNGNCIREPSTEPMIQSPVSVQVDSAGIVIDTISWTSGYGYTGYGPPGTIYAFKVLIPPTGSILTCPSSGIIYDTIKPGLAIAAKYFAFQCSSSTAFDLGIYTNDRVGTHFFKATIGVFNNYCTPTAGVLSMTFSNKFDFGSASPSPASVTGNVITWSFPLLTSLSSELVTVRFYRFPDLTDGDTLHTSYMVTPISGDADTSNNTVNLIDTVKASYDPNHKTVLPAGNITAGTKLQYTIQFENTGHDTAFNIHIMDTLSGNLDIKSLSVLSATANVTTMLQKIGGQNIVKFDFPNINLLDSSHHGECDGMVVFSINTKAGLPYGTKINNRAGIYFDHNEVVMTNTVENIIGFPAIIDNRNNSSETGIYPNPVKDDLNITSTAKINSVTICNLLGQTVYTHEYDVENIHVDVSGLSTGIYIVKINGTDVRKFVKQ